MDMKTRENVIKQAHHECLKEMYAKAQPSVDYDAIVDGVKNGTICDTDKDPVYARHYLSQEEFKYILNKYIDAYGMRSTWHPWLDTVRRYFDGKGMKDVWVEGKIDEYGFKHPGHRTAEDVPHITKAFKNVLSTQLEGEYFVSRTSECYNILVRQQSYNGENE